MNHGARAHVFDHQARRDRAQSDRRHQRPHREGGPSHRRAEAHPHRARSRPRAFTASTRERPFFRASSSFMTSGPVVVQVLEGENAVAKYREVMGATDPAKAAAGTIRKDFAESIEANSVHGSDSPENAQDRDRILLQARGNRRLSASGLGNGKLRELTGLGRTSHVDRTERRARKPDGSVARADMKQAAFWLAALQDHLDQHPALRRQRGGHRARLPPAPDRAPLVGHHPRRRRRCAAAHHLHRSW